MCSLRGGSRGSYGLSRTMSLGECGFQGLRIAKRIVACKACARAYLHVFLLKVGHRLPKVTVLGLGPSNICWAYLNPIVAFLSLFMVFAVSGSHSWLRD